MVSTVQVIVVQNMFCVPRVHCSVRAPGGTRSSDVMNTLLSHAASIQYLYQQSHASSPPSPPQPLPPIFAVPALSNTPPHPRSLTARPSLPPQSCSSIQLSSWTTTTSSTYPVHPPTAPPPPPVPAISLTTVICMRLCRPYTSPSMLCCKSESCALQKIRSGT